MEKYFKLLSIAIIVVFILILSACSRASEVANEQASELSIETIIDLTVEEHKTCEPLEYLTLNGVGGDENRCLIHTLSFCGAVFDHFISQNIIKIEDFHEWANPLRELYYDECSVNIVTFIEHFGIPRETFQQVIDIYRLDHRSHFNLDIIYSGNWALIEQYYSIENQELHWQLAHERRHRFFSKRLIEAQQIVNSNVTEKSLYFHDIWTYASFNSPGFKESYYNWMQGLIDAGEYERVNIVEFVKSRSGNGLTKEVFEHWIREDNLNLFTHYNVDIIFSGDPQLIAEYYSAANQATHTAQVLSAFNQHVAAHGWASDVSPPDIITPILALGNGDQPYRQTLQAKSQGPVVWSVNSGSLPSGLKLASTGAISGTPRESGTFRFTVRAANMGGYTTQELAIEISEIPVQIKAATNITPTTATLHGSFSDNTGTIEYGFYWGTTNNPSNRVVVGTTRSQSHSFSFNLERLLPGFTYFFRAFAGATRGEEVMSFTTVSVPPPPDAAFRIYFEYQRVNEGDHLTLWWGIPYFLFELVILPNNNVLTGLPEMVVENANTFSLVQDGLRFKISQYDFHFGTRATISVPTTAGVLTRSFYISTGFIPPVRQEDGDYEIVEYPVTMPEQY